MNGYHRYTTGTKSNPKNDDFSGNTFNIPKITKRDTPTKRIPQK